MLLPSAPFDPARNIHNGAGSGCLAKGFMRLASRNGRLNPILSGPAFLVEMPNVSGDLDDLDGFSIHCLQNNFDRAQ